MTPCARFFSVIRNGVAAGPKNGNEFNGQMLADLPIRKYLISDGDVCHISCVRETPMKRKTSALTWTCRDFAAWVIH
jgi:hypothetical protein